MKRIILSLAFIAFVFVGAFAQEYKIVTTVESIVPMGLGRSRMVDPQASADYKSLTTTRTDGKKSSQGDVKRDEVKIDNFEETKLLNFYSAVGINFQNIASNDAVVSSKLTELSKEGGPLCLLPAVLKVIPEPMMGTVSLLHGIYSNATVSLILSSNTDLVDIPLNDWGRIHFL